MFGYVTPLKPELKIREYNLFRSYYCGLCFSIKQNFGNLPRMALNYDMTFLGLLLDGLTKESLTIEPKRCMAHPTNKKPVILNNKALSYAAEMNISLVYFKLLDDVFDDGDLKSKTLATMLSPYKKKFSKEISQVNDVISENLKKLSELETNLKFSSIDEICDPFSIIVGKILELYPYDIVDDSKEIRDNLYNLGYALGKWIYLVDALDDLEDDMKKNKFNPINYLFNEDNIEYKIFINNIKERIEFSVLNCACSCKLYLDELNLHRNKDILENIISLGMMDKYTKVANSCNNNCKKKKGSVDFNESI